MSARGCHKDASVEGKFSSIVGVVSVGVGWAQDSSRDMKTAALLSAFGLMRMVRPAPKPRP